VTTSHDREAHEEPSGHDEPRASDSGSRPTASAEHVAELLASISHDLRTPLGIVMGAFREVRDALPPASQPYARLVDRSTERLVALADRLARASAAVSRRTGETKRVARSSLVLRDAALNASARLEAQVRVDLGRDAEVALDGPRATEALANLFCLANPAADPAVHVAIVDGFVVVRVVLKPAPSAGREIERAFSGNNERARLNLDLFFARTELESQGCFLSLEPESKELHVRIPVV
jgi:signal transduction histidine kinase